MEHRASNVEHQGWGVECVVWNIEVGTEMWTVKFGY